MDSAESTHPNHPDPRSTTHQPWSTTMFQTRDEPIVRIASVSGLRGIVGRGLDPVVIASFAGAYAATLRFGAVSNEVPHSCNDAPPLVLIGHDGRSSAPLFMPVVASALAGSGCRVIEVGPVATPTLGFLTKRLGAQGAAQLSASHNPPEYNGLKFFQPEGMVLDPEQGYEVARRFETGSFAWAGLERLGTVEPFAGNPHADHVAAVLARVEVEAIRARRFRVLVDSCHGAGGAAARLLLERLGCDLIALGDQPDGRYDHPPEPLAENLVETAAATRDQGAAVGFVQDPDADRLAVIDEHGRYLGEELTLALAASVVLARDPGPLVINLSTSSVSARVARDLGCPVVRSPVGEIHVVHAMKRAGASLGGEGNGGVIDPRVGLVRDSLLGIALILDRIATDPLNRPLSAIADALPRLTMLKRKFARDPQANLLQLWDRIAAECPEASADRRDGLRLDWPDGGFVHLRASNTEPIVRAIVEHDDPARAEELADRMQRRLAAG